MTNKTFVQSLAKRLDMDEDEVNALSDKFVNTFVQQVLEGDTLSVQGFGNFELKVKAERKMYNPTTKTFKIIPSKRVLGFKMSATLKSRINNN